MNTDRDFSSTFAVALSVYSEHDGFMAVYTLASYWRDGLKKAKLTASAINARTEAEREQKLAVY